MVLVYSGSDPTDSGNWASGITQAAFTYAPLSSAQQSVMQSRGGNPDFITVTWINALQQKRESWVYLSGVPTTYNFLNGGLQDQGTATGTAAGNTPKVDPGLFNPQLTLSQLTAAFGPPDSVGPLDGAPDFQAVHYSFGLDAVFLNGRLSSATSYSP
jgi:hypothetical protein